MTVIVHDDASSRAGAVSNTERLIVDDRVDVLLGPYASDLTRAVVPVARRLGKVVWNHGGATDEIHGAEGNVVGVLTPVSRYFTGALDLIRHVDATAARVVFLYRIGSRFGDLAAQGAKQEAQSRGFNVTPLTYEALENELPAVLGQIRALHPDAVLSAGSFQDDCTLARGLVAGDIGARAFGCVAAGIDEFSRMLKLDAEGIFGPSQWEPAARWTQDFGPSALDVARSILVHGVTPDYPAVQAYATCLVAQRCLEEAGSTDDEAVWQTALNLDCTTFFGRFKIDPSTGLQLGKQMVWVQWQGDQKRIVWPAAIAAEAVPAYPWLRHPSHD